MGSSQGKSQDFQDFQKLLKKIGGRFSPPWAPGWPETDSPRKTIANSGVETRIRALGTHFVAIFRLYVKAKNHEQNAIELLTGLVPHWVKEH